MQGWTAACNKNAEILPVDLFDFSIVYLFFLKILPKLDRCVSMCAMWAHGQGFFSDDGIKP